MEDLYIVVGGIVAIVILVALTVIQRMNISKLSTRLQDHESRRTKLEEEMTVLLEQNRGIGAGTKKKQPSPEEYRSNRSQALETPASNCYQKAHDLLRTGASVQAVITACGVSKGDAEFMLHVRELRGEPVEPGPVLQSAPRASVSSAARPAASYERKSRRVSEVPTHT